MRKHIFFPVLVVLVLALVPDAARAGPGKTFNAESFTLKNGMQVVVLPNHRAPVALQMVWYKIGSADEQDRKTGLAHFLEHLMFKGSPHVPPGEFSKRVRAMGGNDNAFTTHDYTAYFQMVSVSHLPKVMAMEADRMRALTLPPDQFESERQVVLEERRQRTENDPRGAFFDQMRYALFPAHPYGRPVIGWKNDIEHLTRAEAMAWHDKWYNPANAILIVAGDVTEGQVRKWAAETYGKIPGHAVQRPALPPVIRFPGAVKLTLRDPHIHEPQLVRLYRAPSLNTDKKDALALDVLVEIMSGNTTTRLYQALVVDQKIATSAGLEYDDTARGPSVIVAGVSPVPGVSLDRVSKALDAELQKLAGHGVSAQELSEAKTRMKDSLAFTRDSLSAPANIIGEALASGLSLADVEDWASEIDGVSAAQVQEVARKYLAPETSVDTKNPPRFVAGYILATRPVPGAPPAPLQAGARQEIR